MKLGLIAAVVLTACSGVQASQTADDAKRAAACSAARDIYRETRKALFDTGVCDASLDLDQCLAYVVIRETHMAHLERLDCPPEEKK